MAPRKPKGIAVIEVPIESRANVSIEALLTAAVDKNVPIETMERLMNMRRELKSEAAKEGYDRALSKFQSICPIIAKTKEVMNKDGRSIRYSYAPLDSIVSQIREALAETNLSYSFDVPNEPDFVTAICKVTHAMGHSETSSFKVPLDKEGFMSAPQKYASALTFAKRYALCNALGILTGDDDTDTDEMDKEKESDLPDVEIVKYSEKLEATTSLKELSDVWADIPVQAKVALKALKEKLKSRYGNN